MISNLSEEKRLWKKGYKRVACLDEAGRGALAAPVVAAAVVIKINRRSDRGARRRREGAGRVGVQILKDVSRSDLDNIRDSKKLTPKKREELYKILIKNLAIEWGIGRISERVIDRINILEATKLAMKRAIQKLGRKPDFLILDGNFKIDLPIPQKSIIKADEKVFSCVAASVLAKVTRDRIMKRYHKKYPRYGFDRHKGYPTKLHCKMLKKYGPCKIHRKSFRPVKIKTLSTKSEIRNKSQ